MERRSRIVWRRERRRVQLLSEFREFKCVFSLWSFGECIISCHASYVVFNLNRERVWNNNAVTTGIPNWRWLRMGFQFPSSKSKVELLIFPSIFSLHLTCLNKNKKKKNPTTFLRQQLTSSHSSCVHKDNVRLLFDYFIVFNRFFIVCEECLLWQLWEI